MIDEWDDRPSRSAKRRAANAVVRLAERLAALRQDQLERLHLPEEVGDSLEMLRRITSFGARKRQLKRIALVLRESELDVQEVGAGIDELEMGTAAERAQHRKLEAWRDALLGDDAAERAAVVASLPSHDAAEIERLVKQAKAERDNSGPPKAARKLFRYLRGLVDS